MAKPKITIDYELDIRTDQIMKNINNGRNAGAKAASEFLQKQIASEAPAGPTGNLKKSVVSKKMSRDGIWITAIDRMKAPHAHLIEFGARGGSMPANPFFRRTFELYKEYAIRILQDPIKKSIR